MGTTHTQPQDSQIRPIQPIPTILHCVGRYNLDEPDDACSMIISSMTASFKPSEFWMLHDLRSFSPDCGQTKGPSTW